MSEPANAGNNPEAQPRSTAGERARHGSFARGSADVRVRVPLRRVGLSARGQRALDLGGLSVIGLLAVAWTWSIAQANADGERDDPPPSATRTVTAAMTSADAPTAAFVTDAAMEALARRARGSSGKLKVKTVLPEEVDKALTAITDFAQITLTPFSAKERGRIGGYMVGSWPGERGAR